MQDPCLLVNANVYTMDAACPRATALALSRGRIQAVGSEEEVTAKIPEAVRIDVEGRTIIPGLIDAHAHLMDVGHTLRQIDLNNTSGPEEVVARLKSHQTGEGAADSEWIRGHGWDQTNWDPPSFPDRRRLDAAFPNRPVWLTRTDGHAGWANTAALQATVGVETLAHVEPPEGGVIRRDDEGRPTGVLIDTAMELVTAHIPPPSETDCDQALSCALQHTARHGITGLHDAGVDLTTIRRYRQFIEEERFPLRVYAMIDGRGDTFDHFCERGPFRTHDDRLRVESVKFFADGALGSRGAALLDEYADDPGNYGQLRQSSETFASNVRAAVDCGFQVNTHAIGDRANRFVLDVYESVQRETSLSLRRPRIEHAQLLHPDDISRFGVLGVTASMQPRHATSDMSWIGPRLGPERLTGAYAWKSLHQSGARLAFGSDAPVESIDPLEGFHAAVTRRDVEGEPPDGWHPEERLPRTAVLHAYTLGAARAGFQEKSTGSLTPGKRADLTVLSQDIMEIPTDKILDTEVVATFVEGERVYAADEWPHS